MTTLLVIAAVLSVAPEPATLRGQAFGEPVEIVVRDLPSGAQAAAQALAGIAEVERITDSIRPEGGLAVLNATAGRGPQAVEARLFSILSRVHGFCVWSERAYGPLGRDLNAIWGVRSKPPAAPEPSVVEQAAATADCARLTLDSTKATAALAEGSGLDLWGLAQGFAVDRAIELLQEAGAPNVFVQIGSVRRGAGGGPAGRGWPVALGTVPGMQGAPTVVFLRDQALAMTLRGDRPLLVNHRNGRPPEGTLAVAAVSQLAADAQALATILFVAGPREGQMRLGSLSPRPSVLWFMGSGEGGPLQVDYRWSQVPRR